MIINPNNKNNLYQKKSLGQVFLTETWPCEEIVVRLKAHACEKVLEIGPGKGVLTKLLLEAGLHVTAIEKDPRFAQYLKDTLQKEFPNSLVIYEHDFLAFDLSPWLTSSNQVKKAICGNIPYYVSTPIVQKTLEIISQVTLAIFLVQFEFANRLAAEPNSKAYGSLSVYTQLRSQPALEFFVDKDCFTPVPKVDSAVISFLPPKEQIAAELLRKVEHITQKAFSQRRKVLTNSLSEYKEEMSSVGINMTLRAEVLSPEDFLSIAVANLK